MKVTLLDTTGKNKGKTDLPKELFGATPNESILAQYIRVYRHRQRQGKNKIQGRSDVTATKAKVWRQKGTGRARHGARSAPIFVGGGKAHGPQGSQHYTLRMSKKLRRLALLSALNLQAKNVSVVETTDKLTSKTRDLVAFLQKAIDGDLRKVTIVVESPDQAIIAASKNIEEVQVTQVSRLNAFELMNSNHIIFTKKSLELLAQSLDGSKKTKSEKK